MAATWILRVPNLLQFRRDPKGAYPSAFFGEDGPPAGAAATPGSEGGSRCPAPSAIWTDSNNLAPSDPVGGLPVMSAPHWVDLRPM